MLNIHFSNVNFSSSTGPNSFASRLANEFSTNNNINIVGENDPYDIFLVFIEPSSIPREGCKVVHRLDGIWFKPEQFISHNQGIKWAYDNSHAVIWQSEFDKHMTEYHWGPKKGEVIHNGINLSSIEVKDKEILKLKQRHDKMFVSSANWHRQKRLKENIEFFKKNSANDDCLIVMGNNPDYVVEDPRVYYTGSLSHDLCMQVYSAADWMIHLAWLDHCPNVVVEALSQNCPVICSSSGGTAEIVGDNGVIIYENKEYEYELVDYDSPYPISTDKIYLPDIDVRCDYLDIRGIALKYISLFRGL